MLFGFWVGIWVSGQGNLRWKTMYERRREASVTKSSEYVSVVSGKGNVG